MRGKTAQVTVRFRSQLISVTRAKDGAVIDGNPDKVTDVTDVWTFARDITSRDPELEAGRHRSRAMTSTHGRGPDSGLSGSAAAALGCWRSRRRGSGAGAQPAETSRHAIRADHLGQIDGWADDDHDAAFATFLKSCKAILQGEREAAPTTSRCSARCSGCARRRSTAEPQKPGQARAFFEQNFRPVRIAPLGSADGDGFITGYYEPIVEGAAQPRPRATTSRSIASPAVCCRAAAWRWRARRSPPADGGKDKKKKQHGRSRKLVSYYDRAAIDDGALAGRNLEICWLKDPIDAFFAQIQGSVRVRLDDGKLMRLNYDAANGHPYYAVGRWLIDRGIVPKEEMSMDRIREWMERNPKEGEELRRRNKSYVFFRETHLPSDEEPIGAQGISLTPGRSIAVDRKLHTYGTPFFISAYLPIEGLKPDTWFKRLMIAQDTGGAIVGPARADLYFGAGDEAASVAGRLRHYGKFVMLAPKRARSPRPMTTIPLPRPRPPDLMSDADPGGYAHGDDRGEAGCRQGRGEARSPGRRPLEARSKPAAKPAAAEKKVASAPASREERPSRAETAAEKKSDKPADDKKAPAKHTAKSKAAAKSDKPVRSIARPADMTRRRLSDDERVLWKGVTRSIAPLRKPSPHEPDDAEPAHAPVRPKPRAKPAARCRQSAPPKPAAPPPLAPLTRKTKQRIARGRAGASTAGSICTA